MNDDVAVRLLRAVADATERLTEADLRILIEYIEDSGPTTSLMKKASPRKAQIGSVRIEQIASKLLGAKTRSEGEKVLQSEELSRIELAALARAKNVHVVKQDTVSDIESKIVSALIGARLNSQAIRGS